jgi:hypothetical protein
MRPGPWKIAMPNLPYKFLLFVAVGGFFYLFGLPKRIDFVSKLMKNNRDTNREETIKGLVEDKVRGEICPISDLCEYRPIAWRDFQSEDSMSAAIVHEFYSNGNRQTYMFRMRYGALSEIHDLR